MDTKPQWGQPPGGEPPSPGWRPPRRRLPAGAIAGVVLVLVVLLAVSSLGNLRLWPSFPNPFAARQVDRSQPVLLKAIEDLEVYKAASGNFQVVVDLEEGSRGIPLLVKGERTLFVAGGSVDAEVDFSTLDEGAIKVRRRRAGRDHPAEAPPRARVDPARAVFSPGGGLLDRSARCFRQPDQRARALPARPADAAAAAQRPAAGPSRTPGRCWRACSARSATRASP